ncbi:MAG: transposase [Spirochaetaceae bacterium]|nr:transposase [Spirochaetaceae bacterium]
MFPAGKYRNRDEKLKTRERQPKYKKRYSRRMQIIELCFSGIEHCKGMDRFTLRGKKKEDIQF